MTSDDSRCKTDSEIKAALIELRLVVGRLAQQLDGIGGKPSMEVRIDRLESHERTFSEAAMLARQTNARVLAAVVASIGTLIVILIELWLR